MHKLTLNQSAATQPPDATETTGGSLRLFVFALFFIFGGITSLNDVVIPKLKALFTLTYGEVMLVQSAFFTAYFIVSLPAAALVRAVGYMKAAVTGLLMMTAGCLLFVPASSSGLFGAFLVVSGIAQVVSMNKRGSAFGAFNGVFGIAWFLGSATMGALYGRSLYALVAFGAIAQLIAAVMFVRLRGPLKEAAAVAGS